jgi:uncharacterized protein YgiB involved in biofilm formation
MKLKVLRPFDFGDRAHGHARFDEVGKTIERDITSARYLLEYNTERPLVECVDADEKAAIEKLVADEAAAKAKADAELEAANEKARQAAAAEAPRKKTKAEAMS